MTQPAVEFYEAAAEAVGPAPAVSRRPLTPPYLTIGCWLLAAGLACYAPFTRIYAITFGGDSTGVQQVDGWGRLQFGTGLGSFGRHGARYGIGMILVAALLTMLVLVVLARRRVAPRLAGTARVVAVTAPSLLAGLALTIGLDVRATFDEVGQVRFEADNGGALDAAGIRPHAELGPCLWLTTAAIVAAVAGAVLYARHLRPAAAAPVAAPPEAGEMAEMAEIPGTESIE